MFQLIITIISIALVTALIGLTSLYGGETLTDGEARAIATRLKTEEQQLLGAMEIYKAQRGVWPNSLADLVEHQYLQQIPAGYSIRYSPGIEIIRSAYAQSTGGWLMPANGQPIVATNARIPVEVCRTYNLISRGDDGVLKQALTSLAAQCFGTKESLRVVAMQAGASRHLAGALAPSPVTDGGLPPVAAGESWWEISPENDPTQPVDPDKTDRADLVLDPSTSISFGVVQLGQTQLSTSRVIRNVGPVAANSLSITVPGGFSLAANSCAQGVVSGGTCSFSVQFSPADARAFSGVATVAANNSAPFTFNVEGEGRAARGSLSALEFGDRLAGSSTMLESTLRNEGVGPLTLGAPSVQGSDFSLAGTTCASALAVGNSCTIAVRYQARGTTSATGTLSVSTHEAGDLRAALSAHSQQAALGLSVGSRDFGSVQAGQSILGPAVILRNTGNASASVLDIKVPEGFKVASTTCASSLSPGANCSIVLSFEPLVDKAYAGNLQISAGDILTSMALTGNGVAASGTLSAISFGAREAGTVVEFASILLNTGVGPLSVTLPSDKSVTGAGFKYLGTTCGASIAAKSSCAVTVSYTAVGADEAAGMLTLSTGAGELTAPLSGQSQKAVFDVTSVQHEFGPVQTHQVATAPAIIIKNTGNLAAAQMMIYVPNGFRIGSTTCTNTLAPGADCSVRFSFEPTEAKHYSGRAQISAGQSQAFIVLEGLGLSSSATLSDISFGARDAGTVSYLTSTLRNTGVGPLTLTVPNPSSVTGAGFLIRETSCGTTLTANTSCTVTVAYSAAGTTEATGRLSVATSAGEIAANLSGQSRQAGLRLSLARQDFAPVQTGQKSVGSSITLSNTGNAVATSLSIAAPSGFKVESTSCTNSLNPSADCSIRLSFEPTEAKTYSGDLQISSGGVRAATTLSGTGVAPSATLSDVDFGEDRSMSGRASTLHNRGVGPLKFTVPNAASLEGEGFRYLSTTCTAQSGNEGVLAPNATCTVTMFYAPIPGSNGSSARLRIATDAGAKLAALTGAAMPHVTASPTTIDFGSVKNGQTKSASFEIQNAGHTVVTQLTFSGMYNPYTATNSCPTTLQVGQKCTVTVHYAPTTATGPKVTRYGAIVYNKAQNSVTIRAIGEGIN